MESRNVTLIETQPHLLSPPSNLSPLQNLIPSSWDLDDDTLENDYISYDDLLWDVRDYINVLDFTANIPANHENASGVSADPQAQEFVDQIRDFTGKDLLTPAAPLPGAGSQAEPLSGALKEPLSGAASPPSEKGASPEIAGLSPTTVSATARRGAAMHNNITYRPNVGTQCAAAEVAGAVTGYRGVRPNNKNNNNDYSNNNNNNNNNNDNSNNNNNYNNYNNNCNYNYNYAALAERFQTSTLHKL